jgi:hypothetical protein
VVVAAVERYLVSRGIAVAPPSATKVAEEHSCSCGSPQPTAASVSASVVDRFLARRGAGSSLEKAGENASGGYG